MCETTGEVSCQQEEKYKWIQVQIDKGLVGAGEFMKFFIVATDTPLVKYMFSIVKQFKRQESSEERLLI